MEFIINKTVILERGMVFFIRGEGIERDGFGEVWGVFRVSDVCVEDRRCIENKEEYKARFKKITLASVGGPEVCMRCGMHINASKDVPLMWAVERERVDSVKYILRYRINDHVLNEEILNTAASTGNLEILELLCNYPGVLVTPDMIAIAEDYNHQAAAGFLMKKLEEQTRI